jgi:hypothetical protein
MASVRYIVTTDGKPVRSRSFVGYAKVLTTIPAGGSLRLGCPEPSNYLQHAGARLTTIGHETKGADIRLIARAACAADPLARVVHRHDLLSYRLTHSPGRLRRPHGISR